MSGLSGFGLHHGLAGGVGLLCVVTIWGLELWARGQGFGPTALWEVHAKSPVLFVVNLLPVALIGVAQLAEDVRGLRSRLARLGPVRRDARRGWVASRVTEALPDAVLLSDADGTIQELNQAASRVFGYERDEMVRMHISTLLPELDAQDDTTRSARRLERNPLVGLQWTILAAHRDGSSFPAEVTAVPAEGGHAIYVIRDHGRAQARPGSAGDSDDRAELERQVEDQHLFLSRISAELRIPLASLIGSAVNATVSFGGVAREAQERKLGLKRNLDRVNKEVSRIQSFVSNLDDFARINAGRVSIVLEPVQVRDLVASIRPAVADLAQVGRNRFDVLVASDVERVYADTNKLKQVLLALLDNACKFTKSGQISLTVERWDRSERLATSPMVSFQISDTGTGISPAQLSQVFSPCPAVGASVRREHGGTGLSLAICQKLIERMGGEVSARSEHGRGSTFFVRLPEPKREQSVPDEASAEEG